MKKELSPKQLILIGLASWLLSKLPLWGSAIGAALELGGIIAFLIGIIYFIKGKVTKLVTKQDGKNNLNN